MSGTVHVAARVPEALRRAKARVEAERVKYATEHFDALDAELVADAEAIRPDLDEAIAAVRAAASKWHAIGQSWLALERAADISRHTRLDAPKFPFDVVADIDRLPIPPVIDADRDPTLTAA